MRKALQLIVSLLLLVSFMATGSAVAQDTEPQDVTIRDLNTYENLDNIDQISSHPLRDKLVRFTAVVVSNPKTSGLATYNPEEVPPIGRIHVFVTDTTALNDPDGRDGMSMQVVQGSSTTAFNEVENLNRGDVVTVRGRLTFFQDNPVAQFDIEDIEENLGSVNNNVTGLEKFGPLLNPIDISPADFHFSTGPNEIDLDLEAYQRLQGAYVRIVEGTMANYGGTEIEGVVERPSFTVNKDGVFVANRDIGLRYRNDRADQRGGYKEGYNFIRVDDDGFFERPPLGSSVNISGFLVINGFTGGFFEYASGAGFNIAPMEDGILYLTDPGTGSVTRLENGVSIDGTFSWPVDFELIGTPPQVTDVTLSPESTGGSYTSDQTVTVNAIVSPPEDDASVVIDSVIVNYTTASLGTQRLEMTNTGGDNYTVDLPELVDFEAPSLFVQSYGSNQLAGRFPISGAISFFVDGGAITSIETIQRTGDDLDGSSPVADIQDLEYNITATVVSTASDGVISVQEGSGPWSGIFLALESSTVGLQRGDVVNITGGTVREASVANNSVTYTYLEDVVLSVTSSGADLSTVVPVLTTNEFNAPDAPGEAWEGMLVRFENVQMTAALSFGEFAITSLEAGGTLQAESVVINDDTRAGAVGETGFPNDFNLHARIDSTLDSVSGLVTYTFGAAKIIPRELEDIKGDNYTIPRPEFNLNTPVEGASVGVVDGTDIVAEWQSLLPRDYDFNTVTFEWVLYAADSTEIIAVPSDNEGADAQVTIPGSAADGVLASLGISEGESIEALWNVRAIDPNDTVAVAASIDFDTFEPETIYRAITLTRGEVTSNEDFGGIPRTFDLEQNYPNPFNPTTQINYAVPEQSDVRIDVYNVIGRRVATLVDREMAPGNYTVNFNASQLSSGMYFYRLKAGSTLLTKKMTLIK